MWFRVSEGYYYQISLVDATRISVSRNYRSRTMWTVSVTDYKGNVAEYYADRAGANAIRAALEDQAR